MSTINKVILIGNLGADPDLKYTGSGKAVANLSVATTSNFGENEKTEWHRVVVWDKAAEASSKYLRKGSKVYVEGRLETRSWEDNDGNKRYSTEVIASIVQFLDKKAEQADEPAPRAAKKGKRQEAESDLPF